MEQAAQGREHSPKLLQLKEPGPFHLMSERFGLWLVLVKPGVGLDKVCGSLPSRGAL